jgi:membrane protein DedA with SNARE-associated domain
LPSRRPGRDYGDGTANEPQPDQQPLQSYGYYAAFVFIALESPGIPLPGETTLIAAAIYAG